MSTPWEISLDHQEHRRKVAQFEGRARTSGAAEAEEVEFSLTLYVDQASLNVPATTLGREFIAALTAILGPEAGAHRQVQLLLGRGGDGGHCSSSLGPARRDRGGRLRDLHAFLWGAPPAQK